MNMEKVFMHKKLLQRALTFEEISKLYREILYKEYENLEEYHQIHCYQILRDVIDIFTQMRNGRVFDDEYLKDKIKW